MHNEKHHKDNTITGIYQNSDSTTKAAKSYQKGGKNYIPGNKPDATRYINIEVEGTESIMDTVKPGSIQKLPNPGYDSNSPAARAERAKAIAEEKKRKAAKK